MIDAALVATCDQEPIHIPGAIQPHGIVLVARDPDEVVVAAAGAVEQLLDLPDWHGRPLADLIGPALAGTAAASTAATSVFVGHLRAADGQLLDVSVYRTAGYLVTELEPAPADPEPASQLLNRLELAAAGFEAATNLETLCEQAAASFRDLTGFDRVLVYRFLDDEAGKVLAEARRPDLKSFLNHHFPASDIPRQARALYLRNLIRIIPDIAYAPAPLRPAWTAAEPLDMSQGALRSVSPIHLEYLANMGVRASASISIVRDGVLWGLIACHADTPRLMPYDIRVACRVLAAGLARQIKAKEEAEGYRQRIRLRSFEEDIVAILSRDGTLEDTLPNHVDDVGAMLAADGVAILRGNETVLWGIHPPLDQLRALATWIQARSGETVFATDNLTAAYPAGEAFRESASGVLAVVLSASASWLLLWFRVEQVEVVEWAGNPHKADGASPAAILTPRASFDAWQETVRGRARRWTLPEIEAAQRLRSALLEVRQNRRMRDLNRQLTELLQEKDRLLEQKDFLIGEVNHRVQNSLQLVSGFLGFRGRGSDDAALQAALGEARRRISAVALVHRRLYRGDQIQFIDASRYIEELCADTMATMDDGWAKHLSLELAPVIISTDRAVTLGLVLTELIININKYAYGSGVGPIAVRLTEERNSFHLAVADRGVGRPAFRKGFGSRMMQGLVTQLGGTLAYDDNNPGLRATLTAPMQPPSPSPSGRGPG